jgi:BASS family bile acid:Na+ symporter
MQTAMRLDPSLISTATLFAMMLAMGMTLWPRDFARVALEPRAFLIGAAGQLVVLPLCAWAIAGALDLDPWRATGLLLIAACPGGVTSNAVTWLARGDAALSILLTATSSLVSFATVPLVVNAGLAALGASAAPIRLPFAETATTLLVSTALPIALGMAVRAFAPVLAERAHRPLLYASVTVLALLIAGLGVRLGADSRGAWFAPSAAPVLLLVASATGLAWSGARAAGLEPASVRTVGIEVGLQNFNLALVVALSILNEPRYLGPAIVYLPVMLGVAAAWIVGARRGVRLASARSTVPTDG